MSDSIARQSGAHGVCARARDRSRALQRDGHPQDLIGALIFLASADSDFVTGQTIADRWRLNQHLMTSQLFDKRDPGEIPRSIRRRFGHRERLRNHEAVVSSQIAGMQWKVITSAPSTVLSPARMLAVSSPQVGG